MAKESIKNKIRIKLLKLNVGESINKRNFVISLYGYEDYFIKRSFDVHLCNAKKDIKTICPGIEFATRLNDEIKRIK